MEKSLLILFVDLIAGLPRSDARVEQLQIATLADLARIQLAVTVLTLGRQFHAPKPMVAVLAHALRVVL